MAGLPRIEADVAVVGAGGAGLYAALTAARIGARVALISATPLAQTASYWAQGGIAAALAVDDSPDLHRQDTEHAGRGLVRSSAAAVLCRDAPRTVAELYLPVVRNFPFPLPQSFPSTAFGPFFLAAATAAPFSGAHDERGICPLSTRSVISATAFLDFFLGSACLTWKMPW